jgi:asparagine synthase (glutamine-hydrolysing)
VCGFAGILDRAGCDLPPDTPPLLRRMARAIAHRGPDDEQLAVDGPYGVAFRRLSIVDVAGGRQPLINDDGSLVLVANGEIYNHVELRRLLRREHTWKTRSDIEVILHLYEEIGLELLDHLIGMYALALWDRRQHRLLLARDRFGIKPLFYAHAGDQLLFGSEIKALLQHAGCPRAFDWETALTDPWVSGDAVLRGGDPSSYFRGIEQLPAGSYLQVALSHDPLTPRKYWHLPSVATATDAATDPEPYIERYRQLLGDSVRKCLMSDVELGVALSGGIDSAGICALAAQHTQFHTFTVLSRSTFGNDDARHAHATARRFALPNHQVAFPWRDHPFSPAHWRQLLWLVETPLCGPEHLYKYHLFRFAKAMRPALKVMLSGQGSDEFNGGYSSLFAGADTLSWESFIAALGDLERARAIGDAPRLSVWESRVGQPLFTHDYLATQRAGAQPVDPWQSYLAAKARDLQIFNLWHEDRTAAGCSLENRVPFLDHRLVELTLSIPAALRPRLLWDKQILRHALADVLPEEIRHRPKLPFFHGPDVRFTNRLLASLLTMEDQALVEEAFATPSQLGQIVERDRFQAALQAVLSDPEAEQAEFLLRLVNMGLLDRLTREAAPPLASDAPVLPAVVIDDWEADAAGIERALDPGAAFDVDAVLDFAANAYLVMREPTAEWYIAVDDQIRYVVDETVPAWLAILRQLDGHRSLRGILQQLDCPLAAIAAPLAEALDYGVLVATHDRGQAPEMDGS